MTPGDVVAFLNSVLAPGKRTSEYQALIIHTVLNFVAQAVVALQALGVVHGNMKIPGWAEAAALAVLNLVLFLLHRNYNDGRVAVKQAAYDALSIAPRLTPDNPVLVTTGPTQGNFNLGSGSPPVGPQPIGTDIP